MLAEGKVGLRTLADGAQAEVRLDRTGSVIVADGHGRFYEPAFRSTLFSTGTAAVVALTVNTITLTATTTPILGVWNPLTSSVNLVISQASIMTFINNVTSVAPGTFVWAVSVGNGAISTGLTPWNRKTLTQSGSQAKGFAGATALTGLTNSLVVVEAADFPIASGLLTTTVTAATPTPGVVGVQNFDGSLIVPPGGVLALLNTVSSLTHSYSGRLLWEEVPV